MLNRPTDIIYIPVPVRMLLLCGMYVCVCMWVQGTDTLIHHNIQCMKREGENLLCVITKKRTV